jgi:hypothetical protein
MARLSSTARLALGLLAGLILLAASTIPLRGPQAQLNRYTAALEFDFAGWTVDAARVKLSQGALASSGYLPAETRPAVVRELFLLVGEAERLEGEVRAAYAAGQVATPETEARSADLAALRTRIARLQPVAEAILQEQASVTIAAAGLASTGEPFPPVSFHLSQLPVALVVSPRTEIRQDALVQLDPGLSLDGQIQLEARVEQDLGVSALVVPVGGIGTYPTMIEETDALGWVAEVVLHEWTHNWLTLRPLGWNYETSPQLRTMNETTAQLMGQALGRLLVERYYPDLVREATAHAAALKRPLSFDFQAEMHATRVHVDELLAEGKVTEAEDYMETRRQVFVANGYPLRRLNQAYFAFYGAYADSAQGPAGEDPVGAAVRQLWEAAVSPAAFLRQMARMDSVDDLERAVGRPLTTR